MLDNAQAFKFSTFLMEAADMRIYKLVQLPPKLYRYLERNHFVTMYWDGNIYVDPRYWDECSNRKKVRVLAHDLEHMRQSNHSALWQFRYKNFKRTRAEFEIDAYRVSIYARLAFGKTNGIDKALRRLKRYGASEQQLSRASLEYSIAVNKHQKGANPVAEVIERWKAQQ